MHRIALELVGNALNFTDIGYVTISASLAKRENQRLVIRSTVSDSAQIPQGRAPEFKIKYIANITKVDQILWQIDFGGQKLKSMMTTLSLFTNNVLPNLK